MSRLRILIITSCTGEKSRSDANQLTLADFRRGAAHVRSREAQLAGTMVPAEDLYTGLQHERLMRGVQAARASGKVDVELKILSAGYGLVEAERPLAPYETTFAGMKKSELLAWARQLGVHWDIAVALGKTYDLALVLLGEDYLTACETGRDLSLGGPALFLCSQASAKSLPSIEGLRRVIVGNADAKRFSCGLVGLKGEIAARLLERLAVDPTRLVDVLHAGDRLLDFVAGGAVAAPRTGARAGARANPNVDRVIELPESWRSKPHRQKLAYFIPEWDDLVDPDFDFETDTHSGGSGDWSNEVYAHQIYPEPNYDGILISKVVAEKSKKKAERINRLGVHRYLRVPRDFPVMGDCGAFGYINQVEPPYKTDEILDYYTRLDFDFGVSIDHFAIGEEPDRSRRYQLTVENARNFITEHRKLGLLWTPIGAVQGWDVDTYVKAAKSYVAMGYRYLALGGMVPRKTADILTITEAVRLAVPQAVRVHLFGVARMAALAEFARLGVNSLDCATYLRQAWMRTKDSYLLPDGSTYAALRIPEVGKSFRAKRMEQHADLNETLLRALERDALQAVRGYALKTVGLDSCLNALLELDRYVTQQRDNMEPLYRRTLLERPWERCDCPICRSAGVEVVIFRGNNRNRRRGFHNTFAFYRMLYSILGAQGDVRLSNVAATGQMTLELTESANAL